MQIPAALYETPLWQGSALCLKAGWLRELDWWAEVAREIETRRQLDDATFEEQRYLAALESIYKIHCTEYE